MGGKIKAILIAVVVIGVAVYIYNSGIFSKGATSLGSLLSFPSSSSSSTASSSGSSGSSSSPSWLSWFGVGSGPATLPTIPPGPPPTTIESPASAGQTTAINPADIPAGFTLAELSPYFGEINFGGVSAGTLYSLGTITLDADLNQNETVDITGWQIKALNGGEYIPQAIQVYDPSGLTAPSDIQMKNGDVVYLYSSSAPFNLRINECSGYINQFANFTPQIPENCPQVNYSEIQNFTGQCQQYIETLGACQVPDMSNLEIPRTDYACQDYLENNFTYKSCFTDHEGDANFLSNQVWVWMGSNVINPYHDKVELLDRNGLLVAIDTY
jgi:hypothetical protein